MKKNFLLLMILILTSCTSKSNKDILKNTHKEEYNIEENTKKKDEKGIRDSIKENFAETSKIKNSPVKIISSKLYKNQYSDHKDIKLTYKNLTKKDIKAIKFEWYCENVFDEPSNGQYFYVKGVANGHTDILLKSGKTDSKIWEDFSTDAYQIIAARAYFVIFTDGTKWLL
ncbi:MAG: hypothetical protein ABI892_01800 [Flavobacterium sp.]